MPSVRKQARQIRESIEKGRDQSAQAIRARAWIWYDVSPWHGQVAERMARRHIGLTVREFRAHRLTPLQAQAFGRIRRKNPTPNLIAS